MSQLVAEGRGHEAPIEEGRGKAQGEAEVKQAVDEAGFYDDIVIVG